MAPSKSTAAWKGRRQFLFQAAVGTSSLTQAALPTLAAGLAAGVSVCACSFSPDADHVGPDAPSERPLTTKPRVAWVFSSGGPRGFVHVGVIKGLVELKLKPDLIVGSSVGALVGCLYASGCSPAHLSELALNLHSLSVARLAFGQAERFSGAAVADIVRAEAAKRRLQDMPIPMACVALRQRDRVPVAFTAGDAGLAAQASAAIEGSFTPVRIQGQAYVDADHVAPLPVRVAKALGAQVVVAVDASAHLEQAPPGSERFRANDLRKQAATEPDARLADVLIKPEFGYYVNMSREFRERVMLAGYRHTLAMADALRALHRS